MNLKYFRIQKSNIPRHLLQDVHTCMHTDLTECLQGIPMKNSLHLMLMPNAFASSPSRNGAIGPGSASGLWWQSSKCNKLKIFLALIGPTQREFSGHSPIADQESSKALTQDCCSEGDKRDDFGHSNFPSWLQFRSVTFKKSSITKLLFHLTCYSGKKNQFPRLFVKKTAARQTA